MDTAPLDGCGDVPQPNTHTWVQYGDYLRYLMAKKIQPYPTLGSTNLMNFPLHGLSPPTQSKPGCQLLSPPCAPVQRTGAVGTRVTSVRLLGSPAGRGTAWQRLGHRGTAAAGAGWRRPEEEEAGGGGWAGARRRMRRLPRLWLSCWSQGDNLQPRQPPGAIPAAQPAGTPGGEGRRTTTPQHPQGHIFPPNPTPSRGCPCAEPPAHGGSMSLSRWVRSPPGTRGKQPGQNVYAALTPSPKRSRSLL